ncbi:MAG: Serine/threonine protein kinase [Variovorax sp.]|jgi:NAD(P)-dependent dehydrogenase (short-subunit alcohol dehydrogenase family)|nr:Serine/threonine protein kinase [Variovorax sp.]
MTTRLDGRVAIVTGAGAGLGRSHALLLAKQGAKVVVNDLGGSVNGQGGDNAAADKVVAEIRAAGGEAVASYASVSDAESAAGIVKTAVDRFGKLDIVVNNAGILRDKSFMKMEMADYKAVLDVHLMGSVYVTKAAWPIFMGQKYGRVVVTTSVAGTNGNFGQTNYGAAKMALLGLMNCLTIEGKKNNVLTNAISPSANTRMTEGLVGEQLQKYLNPDFVSAAVAWLCSEKCAESGTIIAAGGGGYGRVAFFETDGVQFDPSKEVTVDMFDEAFARIADLATARPSPIGVFGLMEERLKKAGLL